MRLLLCLLILLTALPAAAATKAATGTAGQTVLGSFGGWHAFSFIENNQPVCYMTLGKPMSNAKLAKRGASRLTITHRPGDSSKDVFSYTAGYPFKGGSSVDMLMGKTRFDLFTDKDTAWARDNATDHAIAAAIRANAALTVTGTPALPRAAAVTDRFTLTGAGDAYRAIGKACGYAEDKPAVPATAKKVNALPAKH